MPRRSLSATYRLQLRGPDADPHGRSFTFADAKAIVPYLNELGVSHLYLSPILTAPPSSNHNYDVIDPTEVNPALGGREGFEELAQAAHEEGLGIIIDIVPNHLGIDTPKDNPWWWDVLTYGEESRFNSYFDIDWSPGNGADGKLGIPVLGSPDDINAITIVPIDEDNAPAHVEGSGEPCRFLLDYYGNYFPVRPGTEGDDPLDVLSKQRYALRYWRDGVIGYRRFFSVNGLAGIRQEDPVVFEHTHRVLRKLIAAGFIDGVRVDHPDGLADPFGYLSRLRCVVGDHRLLLIEKILGNAEPLDPRLDVDGTTGYDALRELDGIFINRAAEKSLGAIAQERSESTWDSDSYESAIVALKRDVATNELAAEVRRLARAIRHDNWSTIGRDVTDEELTLTVTDVIAHMPVYRADYLSLSRLTSTVIRKMAHDNPERSAALDLMTTGLMSYGEAWTRFAQVCGAVMAKGVEDTAFYRACRLVALQEVGGSPGLFGVSAAEFHLLQSERANLWPRSMTTLTTHDTKRGEDTRARIIELTEIPDDYREFLSGLATRAPAPDPATSLFLIQNIIGVWPSSGRIDSQLIDRLHEYATKAVREAGLHTEWTDVNEEFETAIHEWIDSLFTEETAEFITSFVQKIASSGHIVSLSRKLLQLLAPGIPDIYQGTEFPEDSLVDPDNRRFVDYHLRRAALAEIREAVELGAHVSSPEGPSVDDIPLLPDSQARKIAVTAVALAVRRERPYSFIGASYVPVFAQGPAAHHAIGFARGSRHTDVDVVVLVTRKPLELERSGGWKDTTLSLPAGRWSDRFTGERYSGDIALADLFHQHPYTVLVRDTPSLPDESPR